MFESDTVHKKKAKKYSLKKLNAILKDLPDSYTATDIAKLIATKENKKYNTVRNANHYAKALVTLGHAKVDRIGINNKKHYKKL